MIYTPDNEAMDAKREELLTLVHGELGGLESHAESLLDSFVSLSPPQDPPPMMALVVANQGGRRGGRTRKPGNIWLNWRKLIRESPDLVLTGAGSIAEPWLGVLAALSTFNKMWAHASIELRKEQAACLVAMWPRCDERCRIPRAAAYSSCKELFSVYQWPEPSDDQLGELISELEVLRCVESKPEDIIWLRERVRVSY